MPKKPRRKRAQPKRVPKKKVSVKKSPKNVIVTVYYDKARDKCIVEPRVAEVRVGGTVSFKSKAGRLTVFVPTPTRAHPLFPRSRGAQVGIPSKGKKLIVSKAKIKQQIIYTYAVYCSKYKTFAEASFPRLIVSP
jgi:hypothetical protein